MIERSQDVSRLQSALRRSPVVLLTGPRQVGKSTLAREVVQPKRANFFDLEDPRDDARLGDPTLSLSRFSGTVVIDEAQRRSDLFPILRVLVDAERAPGRFLVLGSASPDLVGLTAESLAGRIALLELNGLRVTDLDSAGLEALWLRGGLPLSYLASTEDDSNAWRDDYISTFLERDLANLGFRMPATTMRRFWMMLAHYHGQTWNGTELARSLGLNRPTIERYLDAMTDALVVRQLQPWFANLSKRQVRAPKVYLRDTGLLHRLLGISDLTELLGHPKSGASWEGFVIEQLLAMDGVAEPFFWGTHGGAEVDLLVRVGSRRVGVEVKRSDRPRVTPSMSRALEELDLDDLLVAHAGDVEYPLAEHITAVPAADLLVRGPAAFLPG